MSSPTRPPLPWRGLLHLFVVYLVWSSTYLAIRVAVRPGAGFPPYAMAALRCLLACPLLLLWGAANRLRLLPTRRELGLLATSGVLLWTFGHALVVVAEQRMASALAALVIATTPLCVALIEAVVDRRLPSRTITASLLVGFAGTALIGYPALRSGVHADVLAVVLLVAAAMAWGGGSLFHRCRPVELDPVVSAAYQMLFGGLGIAAMSLLYREPWPVPTPTAWWAFAYLLIFGSLISYTSFLKALHVLPTRLVFTYGYVNPVLAAVLGWSVLGERLAGTTLAGAALVLLGVAGAFHSQY